MAVATKIQLPYLEDTELDGKKIYTPNEVTERFRHYIKRIHNIDIKPILTDDTKLTGDQWDTKEPQIKQDFIWGAGPSAIEIITKGELTRTPTQSKPTSWYNYSENITCQEQTHTTAVETSSGQNKKKTKRPKNTGKNHIH